MKKIKDDNGNVRSFPANQNKNEEDKQPEQKPKKVYPKRYQTLDGDEHM